MKLKQPGIFRAIISKADKAAMQRLTNEDGIIRGIFFSTSGALHHEHENPTRHYDYLWQTKPREPLTSI